MYPAQQQHDHLMMPKHVLNWAANVFAVVVLPVRISLLGASLWFFLAYTMAAGTVLMLAEDFRYALSIFARPDIRYYLVARIAIVAVVGIIPFLIGRMLV